MIRFAVMNINLFMVMIKEINIFLLSMQRHDLSYEYFARQHLCSFLTTKCFVKLLEFQWEQIVLICFCIAMNLN